jgi:hypothetical protein
LKKEEDKKSLFGGRGIKFRGKKSDLQKKMAAAAQA